MFSMLYLEASFFQSVWGRVLLQKLHTEIKSIILDIFDVYKTADNNSLQVVKATPLSFNDR